MAAADWRDLGVEPPAAPVFQRVQPHPELFEVAPPENIGDHHPPPRPAGPRGEVVYRGERLARDGIVRPQVLIEDAHGRRPLHPRLDLVVHSSDGFEWGYAGSGPAQLALALLADYLADDEAALARYLDFKDAVICRLPAMGWHLCGADIRAALAAEDTPPPPGLEGPK
jgi:hypothetical protein